MTTMMMWFDNSQRPTSKKIYEALAYYNKKYGQSPNLATLPAGADLSQVQVEGVTVETDKHVLPHHLWIGMADAARKLERHSINALARAEALTQTVKRLDQA